MKQTRLSPRDMVVLTILAEMYGAPMDLVALLLGVSLNRAYRIVKKWAEAHLVSGLRVRPVPGPNWVFVTKSAAEALLGRSVRYWVPTPKMADHVATVIRVRMALVGTDLARWTSERELRGEIPPAKAGESRPHIHDGRYLDAEGRLWAVEVELTAKNAGAAKAAVYKAWSAAKAADCDGLIYYCRGAAIKNVIRTAAAELNLSDGPRMRLADVDELLAPATPVGVRPGFRLIAGGAADHTTQVEDPNEDQADTEAMPS